MIDRCGMTPRVRCRHRLSTTCSHLSIFSSLKQSGHTRGSVCCLLSSVMRHNQPERDMLLMDFEALVHTEASSLNLQTTAINVLFTFRGNVFFEVHVLYNPHTAQRSMSSMKTGLSNITVSAGQTVYVH